MSNCHDFIFSSKTVPANLRVRRYAPVCEAIATVQIIHGIAEHCERYDEFCTFLCENGFAVYVSDLRGHGKSVDKHLGYFADKNGWMTVVDDMHEICEMSKTEYPDVPHVLFGHSMGSFLARTILFTYSDDFDAAIICGTAQMPEIMVKAGYSAAGFFSKFGAEKPSKILNNIAFGTYNNSFKPVRTQSDWLSRDNEVVDKYITDPLCGFIPSVGLFRDMMGGLKLIADKNNLTKMKKSVHVFFIAGDKDPVGENGAGVKRAYDTFNNAGMEDVELKLYPEARHEILNEINKYEVFDDILNWINNKLGGNKHDS